MAAVVVAVDVDAAGGGAAVELVGALAAAGEGAAGLLELVHAHCWEGGGGMVLGGVVVDFVDGDGGVDDVGLDGLLVDDGLNGLMDMMMDMLASNGRLGSSGMLSLNPFDGILVLRLLSSKRLLHLIGTVMFEVSVLNADEVVVMLLRQNFSVIDGLDGSVVVILMNLLVDCGSHTILLVASDGLVLDGGSYSLVDGRVVVAILAGELLDCVFGGLHIG